MVYFPPAAWDNVKEFFFMKPILDRAAEIARRCVEARSKLVKQYRGCTIATEMLDIRSKPFMMHLWIRRGCNMEWNYEELYNIRDNFFYDRYFNIFTSPHKGHVGAGLTMHEFRKLLKMNGVKGVSKMKKADLVRAYLAL